MVREQLANLSAESVCRKQRQISGGEYRVRALAFGEKTTDHGSAGAGVYYVTLLLDGEPIVKKAVKVQR